MDNYFHVNNSILRTLIRYIPRKRHHQQNGDFQSSSIFILDIDDVLISQRSGCTIVCIPPSQEIMLYRMSEPFICDCICVWRRESCDI